MPESVVNLDKWESRTILLALMLTSLFMLYSYYDINILAYIISAVTASALGAIAGSLRKGMQMTENALMNVVLIFCFGFIVLLFLQSKARVFRMILSAFSISIIGSLIYNELNQKLDEVSDT